MDVTGMALELRDASDNSAAAMVVLLSRLPVEQRTVTQTEVDEVVASRLSILVSGRGDDGLYRMTIERGDT